MRTFEGMTAMLDPIVNFFTRVFQWIGRGIGLVIGIILWPFMWARPLVPAARLDPEGGASAPSLARARRPLRLFLLEHAGLDEFQSGLCRRLQLRSSRHGSRAGEPAIAHRQAATAPRRKTCTPLGHRRRDRRPDRLQRQPERLDLLDDPLQARAVRHRLGQHALLRQQGVVPARHQPGRAPHGDRARRHARPRARHLADRCQTCRSARGNLQFDEDTWYFGLSPFGPKTPTPSFYRAAISDLQRLQRPARELRGDVRRARRQSASSSSTASPATSARPRRSCRERSENYNHGWFDTRADDRFWFAYGQLYGYYGILTATRARLRGGDRAAQPRRRSGTTMEDQFRAALRHPAVDHLQRPRGRLAHADRI